MEASVVRRDQRHFLSHEQRAFGTRWGAKIQVHLTNKNFDAARQVIVAAEIEHAAGLATRPEKVPLAGSGLNCKIVQRLAAGGVVYLDDLYLHGRAEVAKRCRLGEDSIQYIEEFLDSISAAPFC